MPWSTPRDRVCFLRARRTVLLLCLVEYRYKARVEAALRPACLPFLWRGGAPLHLCAVHYRLADERNPDRDGDSHALAVVLQHTCTCADEPGRTTACKEVSVTPLALGGVRKWVAV